MTGTLRPDMLVNCMRPSDSLMQRQGTTQAPGPGASLLHFLPFPLLHSHFDTAPPSSQIGAETFHAQSSSADNAAMFFVPSLSLFILRLVAEGFKAVYKAANNRAK